ncbi:hypothetical protein ACJJTC_009531 [Scirpophaga incertulas]
MNVTLNSEKKHTGLMSTVGFELLVARPVATIVRLQSNLRRGSASGGRRAGRESRVHRAAPPRGPRRVVDPPSQGRGARPATESARKTAECRHTIDQYVSMYSA